jgi:hypothetical protein
MKYSIHNKLNILFLLALFFSASSCSEPENRANQKQSSKPDHEFTVSGINDYDFLFNETDSDAAITFNSNELKECRLSFIRANFNLGYTTRITKLGEGNIDLTCRTDQELFILSDDNSTYTEMKITELDKKASITLSFSLLSLRTKKYLTKENVTLELNSLQINRLKAQN